MEVKASITQQWINHWTLESLNALLSGFGWKASYVNDKSLEVQIALSR